MFKFRIKTIQSTYHDTSNKEKTLIVRRSSKIQRNMKLELRFYKEFGYPKTMVTKLKLSLEKNV